MSFSLGCVAVPNIKRSRISSRPEKASERYRKLAMMMDSGTRDAPCHFRGRIILALPKVPLWYKDAVIYQVHVRAMYDSNGDGIGDFRGLAEKLDYLQELGISAIWLMPFFPSPLRDDGYDISNYRSVHPSYGTLEDFKSFLTMAHQRGLRVIIEMVLNHTSDQHPWFLESRSSQDNPKRNWYVWNESDSKYRGTRIIFLDTEMSNWAWDPISKSYY